jgi:hypothetical protein
MSAFVKPSSLKAALKMALYGPAGSGKTFTALLLAEGLARHAGKRVAVVDTEMGSAFYAQQVEQRAVHPEAFDFDVLHSKAVTEVLAGVRGLDLDAYGVLVVDSISHIWDSCRNAYTGRQTKIGSIPLHAWTAIKKPYKELMHLLLSTPLHVLICGRQGIDYTDDDGSGELKSVGYKMRAEGETAYEPDVLVRLESFRSNRKTPAIPVAHVEKDRTGILAGKSIDWPAFDSLARPLLGLLGTKQAQAPTDDEVSLQDAEALARAERDEQQRSTELAGQFIARMTLAETPAALEQIGRELTPAAKKLLYANDLARIRKTYAACRAKLQPAKVNGNGAA